MAIAEPKADVPGITRPMTYEEYLASPEEMARYDILDGWKVYRLYGEQQLANPTVLHQQVQGNLYVALRAFASQQGSIRAIMAPCDVLVGLSPRLRARQPDLLIISQERFGIRDLADASPLNPAPELVIEILSPSDKPGVLSAKTADYHAADVREVWVVRTEVQTVEVVRLSAKEIETVATYSAGQTAVSLVFDGLSVSVDDLFAL